MNLIGSLLEGYYVSDFTQGTIISGIRSKKYPEIICNAIIISARCDLVNCKVV